MRQLSERRQQTARPGGRLHPGHLAQAEGRVRNKKKPTQKTHLKKLTQIFFFFFFFFLILILFENNTNFSL